MVQFSVRSLMFITALLASYLLMMSESVRERPTLAGFAGWGLFVGLLLYNAARDVRDSDRAKLADQNKQEKRPD
jgi:hypothetical protein